MAEILVNNPIRGGFYRRCRLGLKPTMFLQTDSLSPLPIDAHFIPAYKLAAISLPAATSCTPHQNSRCHHAGLVDAPMRAALTQVGGVN